MTEASVLKSLSRQRAADCFTTSRVSLHQVINHCQPSQTFYSPRHQKFGDLHSKSFSHVFTTDVGDALEGEGDVHWVPRGEVILDALHDQLNQLRVARDENRDEQVALQ